MSSKAFGHFNFAIKRSENLLLLYDIIHNQRERRVRKDWGNKFRELMHWPSTENFVRIDGKESILILKQSLNIDGKRFKADFVDEILRSVVVCAVSAYDRYFHDLIIEKVISILSKKEEDIPKELKNFDLPALATKRALDKLKKDPKSRPGNILKSEIQKVLHDDFTFINVYNIDKAVKILDVDDYWNRVSRNITPTIQPKEIQNKIKEISLRRNQIAHEADLIRKLRAKQSSLRPIKRDKVDEYIKFIKSYIVATNNVI